MDYIDYMGKDFSLSLEGDEYISLTDQLIVLEWALHTARARFNSTRITDMAEIIRLGKQIQTLESEIKCFKDKHGNEL